MFVLQDPQRTRHCTAVSLLLFVRLLNQYLFVGNKKQINTSETQYHHCSILTLHGLMCLPRTAAAARSQALKLRIVHLTGNL